MKLRLLTLALVVALVSTLAFAPAKSAQAQGTNSLPVPINFSNTLGSFSGVFNITQFAVQNGQLVAIGTLTGTVKDALGNTLGSINQPLTLPVLSASGSCQVLHLELGPLDLNLLGLQVHLDKVVLDITAQSGPGNLLGNLLCSVAHLLDNPNGLAGLLNNILRAL